MQAWKLRESGFSYDVVAVFGSQSTGKSARGCLGITEERT